MIGWWSDTWSELGKNANSIEAIAGIIAIVAAVFYLPRWYMKRRNGPDRVLIANPEAILSQPLGPPPNTLQMDVDTFASLQSKLRDEARTELAAAHGAERQRLEDKIETLNARLRDPEEALAQQHAIITSLEDQLARRGNEIGGDDLAAATTALEAGDFTKARTLFETLAARTAPEVTANADASFALGQIAEVEIRWHDAATHYARAASLNPTFDTLYKAREFAWRAGNYPAAFRYGEDLLATARKDGTQTQLSIALNEHALTVTAQGRYPEAEGLFRQALEIDRATIGEAHPAYANHLNNLAGVVQAQGRYPEAEGLYRQALEIDRATIGEGHPSYATHLNNLAAAVEVQGRYPEAEGLSAEAMGILRKTLGDGHPTTRTGAANFLDLITTHLPASVHRAGMEALLAAGAGDAPA